MLHVGWRRSPKQDVNAVADAMQQRVQGHADMFLAQRHNQVDLPISDFMVPPEPLDVMLAKWAPEFTEHDNQKLASRRRLEETAKAYSHAPIQSGRRSNLRP
jgi:hypothetical protein